MESTGLKLENNWTKPKLNKIHLLKSVLKVVKDISTGAWLGLPSDAVETVESLKFEDKPGKVGWKLISRSLLEATIAIIIENKTAFEKEYVDVNYLDDDLNSVLESEEVFVGIDFFKKPQDITFLQKAKPILAKFLKLYNFSDVDIDNHLTRLDSYFIFSLVNEWRKNYKYYVSLKDALVTPFDDAAKKENEWLLYSKWLNKQVESPVFSESFSLRQIYIPLRAYNKKRANNSSQKITEDASYNKEYIKEVVDLESELLQWINRNDKEDSLRVIRGGPGYGKSSFMKMFAASLASQGRKLLFIPLHRFEIKDDLGTAVLNFLKYDEMISFNPFEDERLIIFFDGLDELSMRGSLLSEAANQFIREIERKLSNYNSQKLKLQVVISGRDVIVQQNESELRKDGQILSLLPYYLTKEEKDEYADPKKLMQIDQRILWWRQYGRVGGKGYSDMPKDLKNRELDEITAQPLLNYLVALSYERGKINFSSNTNLNEIYDDLLEAVYSRNYAEGKVHHVVKKMELKDFTRMLEEIAIAAWHGNGRTTTVVEIENHFTEGGLRKLLDDFIKDAEKGVVSLLAAFYFRQAGHTPSGSQTFEFTHKSFGEYLTAKRIVNKLFQINNKLFENEKNFDEGWNVKYCLSEWIKLSGAKDIDSDLLRFIQNELKLRYKQNQSEIENSQPTLIKLINQVLKEGMPLEKIDPRPPFFQEYELSLNAEKAVLILLGSVASLTNQVSSIDWPTSLSFGEWLGKLQGQRVGPSHFILSFLNHLNLSNLTLDIRDFYGANCRYSIFKNTELHFANFVSADLFGADFTFASLNWSNFLSANCENTNFSEARMEFCNFTDANLRETNFTNASLINSIMTEAQTKGAIFDGAKLAKVPRRVKDRTK